MLDVNDNDHSQHSFPRQPRYAERIPLDFERTFGIYGRKVTGTTEKEKRSEKERDKTTVDTDLSLDRSSIIRN